MFMEKFGPSALNFGYDFFLLVHFWDTLYWIIIFRRNQNLWTSSNLLVCNMAFADMVRVSHFDFRLFLILINAQNVWGCRKTNYLQLNVKIQENVHILPYNYNNF